MEREKILLSNIDLEIMEFLKNERIVNEIIIEMDMGPSQVRKHIKRLEDLKFVQIEKYGTFKKIRINNYGGKILHYLKK